MAVQAHYPSIAFSPDFGGRARNDLLEELQMLQDRNLLGAYAQLVNNGGGVFSDPQSDLTCNASGQRKRSRDQATMAAAPIQHNQISASFRYPAVSAIPAKPSMTDVTGCTGNNQSRMLESVGTSTSGRPLAHDLLSHLCHQRLEIDALLRLQNERLRSGLEEARKRHCRILLSAVEQKAVRRLKEKEAELENASKRNMELEEKVRQMSAENQIWFNVAKNNEAIVSSLRSSLEQVLQNNINSNNNGGEVRRSEGFGDSDDVGGFAAAAADDAESCCFEGGEKGVAKVNEQLRYRRSCKVCNAKDVCVLLLPCRHLCLCKDCDSKVDTCPICNSTKNASLYIFMP
ncbi:probable BOI-related E3 ubiquitin-protein ligase 2 [Typha angustifolia]|uniref:probable BOI-related E3 ubiquitin-protein ligase 2 n=1 Tax=Typha angustifolia TaxID=59011 RepID=UPI003C2F57B7